MVAVAARPQAVVRTSRKLPHDGGVAFRGGHPVSSRSRPLRVGHKPSVAAGSLAPIVVPPWICPGSRLCDGWLSMPERAIDGSGSGSSGAADGRVRGHLLMSVLEA